MPQARRRVPTVDPVVGHGLHAIRTELGVPVSFPPGVLAEAEAAAAPPPAASSTRRPGAGA